MSSEAPARRETTLARARARSGAWVVLAWAVVVAAVFAIAWSLLASAREAAATDADERIGLATIGRLTATIEAADDFRADRAGGRDGNANAARVDALLAALRRDDARLPSRMALGSALERVVNDWAVVSQERDASRARLASWVEELFDASVAASNRSGLSFDTDSYQRDLGDAYAIRYPRSFDRFADIDDLRRSVRRSGRSVSVRLLTARLNAEALAAARIGTSDVTLAAESAPALVGAIAHDASDAQLAVGFYGDAVFDENDRAAAPDPETLKYVGRNVVDQERSLDARVGAVLDGELASDERAMRDRAAAIVIAAALIAALGMLLVAVVAKALQSARELDRLAAERDGERALAAVQRELLAAERLFRATFEHAPIGILIVDAALHVVDANGELAATFADVDATIAAERALFERVLASGETEGTERRYARADGAVLVADIALRRLVFGDRIEPYVIATFRDVSERTILAERLAYEAKHDALTSLPNRHAFEEALRAARDGQRIALLYLDLDGFKLVNDAHGHHAGDYVLTIAAERLRGAVRADDFVGRIGGDEFAVLLVGADAPLALQIAKRIVAVLREPIAFEGRSFALSASVGAVTGCDGGGDAEQVFRDADSAMYRAKELGGDRCIAFDPSMREASRRRIELTGDLRRALADDEIGVVYQPIFDLRSERLTGYEALARWEHPEKGTIPPNEFVPIAEAIGCIEALGRRVLLESCRQLAAWRDDDPAATTLTMNVNVAAQQILSGSIIDDLRAAIAAYELPARYVTLEITESTLLDNTEQTNATLAALRAMGARICIDDFGTGYSSLLYLQRFPIDGIKVDRSFVSSGGGEALASPPIVEMLATLARVLDLSLVVEGIETRTQLGELLALGCERGQGYLLSKPVPPALALPARQRARAVAAEALALGSHVGVESR